MNYSKLSWHLWNIINDSKWQAVSLVHLVLLRSLDRALAESHWNLVWKDSMLYSYDKVVGLITCKFLTLRVDLKKSFPLFCARQVHFTCQGQFFPFFFKSKLTEYFSLSECEKKTKLSSKGFLLFMSFFPHLWLILRLPGFLLYMIALPLYLFSIQSLVRY